MLEHKTLSLAEQVFERLERDILCGTYPRGEMLTELKLVNDLGVSRTPIREALRRLEQEHLIEISARGILVIGVTQKDLEDIFAIRMRMLETHYYGDNKVRKAIREALDATKQALFFRPRRTTKYYALSHLLADALSDGRKLDLIIKKQAKNSKMTKINFLIIF